MSQDIDIFKTRISETLISLTLACSSHSFSNASKYCAELSNSMRALVDQAQNLISREEDVSLKNEVYNAIENMKVKVGEMTAKFEAFVHDKSQACSLVFTLAIQRLFDSVVALLTLINPFSKKRIFHLIDKAIMAYKLLELQRDFTDEIRFDMMKVDYLKCHRELSYVCDQAARRCSITKKKELLDGKKVMALASKYLEFFEGCSSNIESTEYKNTTKELERTYKNLIIGAAMEEDTFEDVRKHIKHVYSLVQEARILIGQCGKLLCSALDKMPKNQRQKKFEYVKESVHRFLDHFSFGISRAECLTLKTVMKNTHKSFKAKFVTFEELVTRPTLNISILRDIALIYEGIILSCQQIVSLSYQDFHIKHPICLSREVFADRANLMLNEIKNNRLMLAINYIPDLVALAQNVRCQLEKTVLNSSSLQKRKIYQELIKKIFVCCIELAQIFQNPPIHSSYIKKLPESCLVLKEAIDGAQIFEDLPSEFCIKAILYDDFTKVSNAATNWAEPPCSNILYDSAAINPNISKYMSERIIPLPIYSSASDLAEQVGGSKLKSGSFGLGIRGFCDWSL